MAEQTASARYVSTPIMEVIKYGTKVKQIPSELYCSIHTHRFDHWSEQLQQQFGFPARIVLIQTFLSRVKQDAVWSLPVTTPT